MLVRAERLQRGEPFGRCAVPVERPLLFLRAFADALLERGIRDRNEMSWLLVRAVRGAAGGVQTRLDDGTWHGARIELADGAPPLQFRVELARALQHLSRTLRRRRQHRHQRGSVVHRHASFR